MKKITKINLHTLSQAEMADRELNLLRGGSGSQCACAAVCMQYSCLCKDSGDSGAYPNDNSNASNNLDNEDVADSEVSEVANTNSDEK